MCTSFWQYSFDLKIIFPVIYGKNFRVPALLIFKFSNLKNCLNLINTVPMASRFNSSSVLRMQSCFVRIYLFHFHLKTG